MDLELHGPTLVLRYPRAEDAEALLELASDPQVTRWFSWGPYTDVEQPRRFVASLAAERERGVKLDLLVVHREHGPAGITGLSEVQPRDRRCVCGTWLGRAFWGTGVNRESKGLLMHLAFETLGLHRFGSYSNPENARSGAALAGVGLRDEGVLRGFHRHGERHLDVRSWSLLRDEWAASPLRAELEGRVRVLGEPPPAFVAGG